jgi:hypothetical protein
MERLDQIKEEALRQIKDSEALEKLGDIKVQFLGKKGELTGLLKSMKDIPAEDRPKMGQMVNAVREEIETALENAKKRMEAEVMEARLKAEVIDVTLPAKKNLVGHRHPNFIALEEIERIFVGMGYEVVEGPEVEKDYYNFEALNIPADHPAKDEQDTFYIGNDILLRTQTSPIQVREMEKGKHGASRKGGEKAEVDEDGYMGFSLPWSISFGYGITMREDNDRTKFNYNTMRYPYKFTQNLNMSGNIRISDGWNISFSSGYDFENKKISMTTASLSRDLHCFSMSCSVVLAPYTSYNFSFRCNAATLTDALKYDKRSSYSNAVQWY